MENQFSFEMIDLIVSWIQMVYSSLTHSKFRLIVLAISGMRYKAKFFNHLQFQSMRNILQI